MKVELLEKGLYIAIFYLPDQQTITVGQFGRFVFNRGYYFYVGSAQRNLSARLERHSKKKKSLRWHIDYLSVKAEMFGAIMIPGQRTRECEVACELGKMWTATNASFRVLMPTFEKKMRNGPAPSSCAATRRVS